MSEAPEQTDLPVDAGDGWRRVHPVTPVLLVWQVLAAIIAVLVFQVGQELAGTGGWTWVMDHLGTVLMWLGIGVVVVVVVVGIYSSLSWRKMRYRVDGDGVELNQGILFRQQRRAALARVQAVDLQQPLLGRMFGLARVKVETAGAADSNVTIAFLRLADATALRAEVLARAAGVDLDEVRIVAEAAASGQDAEQALRQAADRSDGGTGASGSGAPGGSDSSAGASLTAARTGYREAPERVVFEVDNSRLVASTVLSGGFVVIALMLVGVIVVLASRAPFAALAGFLPGVVSVGGFVWSRFSGAFSFTSATSPDGVRVRRGLLETTSQTIPPRRVQAVRLRQPLLWRWRGWWRVEGYIAGYGVTEGSFASSSSTLMPVGTRSEALTAMWLVVPDLGADDLPAVLDAGLDGSGDTAGFLTSPRRARWLDPKAWRRQAVLVTREAILLRTGWLTRQLEVVPHGRTQSVGITQGPWERRLRLANLHMHTVSGPGQPAVQHLDEQDALALLRHQAERAREARHREGPEEWARRVAVLPDVKDRPDDGAPSSAQPPGAAGPQGVTGPGFPEHVPPASDLSASDPSAHGGPVPQSVTAPEGSRHPGASEPTHRRGPDGGSWSPSHGTDGQQGAAAPPAGPAGPPVGPAAPPAGPKAPPAGPTAPPAGPAAPPAGPAS
ncbi:PH domain-containing protein [Georgenia sp. Z1491]|uniref:PH domain-containing protein n=1 Tax=Georgenia sp. Z1491 TaxID=3416707 RepID=UPI003CEDBE7A